MGNLSDSMQSTVDEIRSAKEAQSSAMQQLKEDIGVRLSEIRSDTHNLMERFRREDTERKGAVGEMLGGFRQEDNERKRAVKDMIGEFRKADNERKGVVSNMLEGFRREDEERKAAVGEMLREVASDVRQAHQIWTEGLKKKIKPEGVVEKVEEKVKAKAGPDEKRVLEVITRHPEGIRLVDIGNELGVDWRILIGPAKSLVDTGQVEKLETMYYPKKEE